MEISSISNSKITKEIEKKYLILILCAGFILRIFICFFSGLPNLHTDTYMYFDQANAISKGSYINYAPNGYPFIIALFHIISTGKTLINLLLCLNIILGTISIYFTYNISKNLFNNSIAAFISGAIICLYPNQLNYTRWLLTEIPSTFFILAASNFYLQKKNFLSGIFYGISAIMRPTLFPIWIAMFIFDFIQKKRLPIRLILGGALIIFSTCTYSYIKTGEFAIAGNSKVNIIYSIYTFGGNIAWDAPQKHPEIKTSRDAKIAYFREAIQHPIYFLKQRIASLWQLWGPIPSTLGDSRSLISRIIIGVENIFLIITGICGFCLQRKNKMIIVLILPIIIITFIHTMMLSLARYTVPMEPFLIVPSGYAIFEVWNRRKQKHEKEKISKTI
ncbi:glycosyltransferase family 39 protein [Thermoflavifilum thermophilum]|uniref:Dolichyl-phosphate-mannose-protein mannosyltransferase n=1 Tax=Thermoflavifilum thermophilum TaxID=1393122 RepID=A0A1I7NEB9_9BACT|nr:glycosyltransferase family 39 protein [Thermoflavifilum thermophilum]SFV33022.1 Dolichyl-phosphate-mannose-protein mannosyltransferase [Thermoflavifilum thermophilum]